MNVFFWPATFIVGCCVFSMGFMFGVMWASRARVEEVPLPENVVILDDFRKTSA